MARRFSSEELRILRNNVPIDRLIKDKLMILSEVRSGLFRFACPICGDFNTAISLSTNLSRCFKCDDQFNTIEMVMHHQKTDFVKAVKFLQEYHLSLYENSLSQTERLSKDEPQPRNSTDKFSNFPAKDRKPSREPIHIGQILSSLSTEKPLSQVGSNPVPDRLTPHHANLINRIETVERKLGHLSLQLKRIESIIKDLIIQHR